MSRLVMLLGLPGIVIGATPVDAEGRLVTGPGPAPSAAVHPVADEATMRAWLARVPVTRDFPPDFAVAVRGQSPAFVIEMSTAPDCAPCADLWSKLRTLQRVYGLRLSVLGSEESMLRSGRFGLPWVGHPVAWVRAADDETHMVPIAIGTDHAANVARNIYLAFKMMTGVRAAVGVRAMARYTGIVGTTTPHPSPSRK